MTRERFEEIMKDDDIGGKLLCEPGCNVVKGLLIIQKYLPNIGIVGAEHDVVYSALISHIVKAGITEEDAIYLRKQNWMIDDDDYLACFV